MIQKFTVLFDLDGTLVNTAPDLMEAHNYVMKKYGFKEKEISEIRKLAGKGSKVMLSRSIGNIGQISKKFKNSDEALEIMTQDFINFYSNNINKKSNLITGVLKFLNWCKNNNISMAVCTNKKENLSIDLLKKINIYHYFEYVAGGDTFNHNKPDPRHLTDVIEIVGGSKKKSIMVGDSETDSEAAKNAGLPFVLIKNGYTIKSPKEIYHDYLVENYLGMEKIIKKYFND